MVLHFQKDDGVDWKEKQAEVDLDTNEEDMAHTPTQRMCRGRRNKIVVDTVVKAKVGEL